MNAKSKHTLLVVALLATVATRNANAVVLPSITNLKAWYQPSTLASGPLISSWTDSSGNGFHLSATGTFNPTLVTGLGINNYNGVHFVQSVSDPLTRALFNNSSTSSIFVVAQVLAPITAYGIWLDGQGGRQTMYHYNNEYSMYAGTEQQDIFGGSGGTNDLGLHRYMATFNGASSLGGIDGVESGAVSPGTDALGTLVVGDFTLVGNGQDTTVNIAEVIIYDRVLTVSERAQIDEYLFQKFFAPPVPEPSTLALLGLGAIGLAIKSRRRRRTV